MRPLTLTATLVAALVLSSCGDDSEVSTSDLADTGVPYLGLSGDGFCDDRQDICYFSLENKTTNTIVCSTVKIRVRVAGNAGQEGFIFLEEYVNLRLRPSSEKSLELNFSGNTRLQQMRNTWGSARIIAIDDRFVGGECKAEDDEPPPPPPPPPPTNARVTVDVFVPTIDNRDGQSWDYGFGTARPDLALCAYSSQGMQCFAGGNSPANAWVSCDESEYCTFFNVPAEGGMVNVVVVDVDPVGNEVIAQTSCGLGQTCPLGGGGTVKVR